MNNNDLLTSPNIRWYQLLRYQIPLTMLILLGLLASIIVFTLTSVNARKHDYAILNLASQLRIISTSLLTQSKQYQENAPRDYPTYYRDLKMYAKTLNDQVMAYDKIIQGLKERKLGVELTGLDSELTCNWDKQSISQLDLTAEEWFNFKAGLKIALGNNKHEPKLEHAATFILNNAKSLKNSTDLLATAFRQMMQIKLDTLILTIKILLSISVIISAGLIAQFYFRVQKPLQSSLKGLDQISNGVLEYRIKPTTNNELSILAKAINEMASSLNAIFRLTSQVNDADTVDDTLQTVFKEFNTISPINWTGIFSVNATRSKIKLDRLFSDFESHLQEGQEFDFNGSFMSEMIDRGKIKIINDLSSIKEQLPDSAIVKLHELDKLNSVLLLPLTTSFKDDSVIVFASHHLNAYDKEKSGLIRFIGNQLTHSFEKNVVMENLVISAVEGLAKLAESRDPETGDHLLRMSIYSSIIAQQLKTNSPYADQIDNRYVRDILRFSPMHDIGKVGIEDSILLKPGKLTNEERTSMQMHPVIGGDVLRRCESQMNLVGHSIFKIGIEIADAHHEKFDGSGYPNQLSGTDIPLAARIVALADVFDALTSKRPYKEAWPVEKALDLLEQESGKHFDPVIIQAFNDASTEIMATYEKHKHV